MVEARYRRLDIDLGSRHAQKIQHFPWVDQRGGVGNRRGAAKRANLPARARLSEQRAIPKRSQTSGASRSFGKSGAQRCSDSAAPSRSPPTLLEATPFADHYSLKRRQASAG